MIAMTLDEIAGVVGGHVVGDGGTVVSGPAFVDSRAPELGGFFVAVTGDRVDGHDFAEAAVGAGAAAVLGSSALDLPMVVVEDPREALGTLAQHVLSRLDVRVVALTGSQGKTGTKDMLAGVLAAAGPTVATVGSFNNELGLPLTVLRAGADTRFLVLEMGARGVGHLAHLCRIAPPHVSVVLNVGKSHLGEFGSREAIAQAKGELVEALDGEGVAVLNADDPLVRAMAARTAGTVRTFGESPEADVRLADLTVDGLGRPSFTLVHGEESAPVRMQLLGEHQALNATAAAAAALTLGVGLPVVAEALTAARPASRWRMELHERADGVVVVNDAYNASPDSMQAALKTLAAMGRGRGPGTRTIAVLGEMRELGPASTEEHDRIGRLAVRLDISRLLVVGEAARPLHLGAYLEGSWGEESTFVPDHDQALAWLREHVVPGDIVLFKASRAAGLERLAEALLAEPTDPAAAADQKESHR